MKKETLPKVTLVYHPNKTLGEKYEVTKIVGTVLVRYDNPANIREKLTIRVHDFIDEKQALSLADVSEVTTLQEK